MVRMRRLSPLVAVFALVAVASAPAHRHDVTVRALSPRADHVPTAAELGVNQPVPGDAAMLRTAGKGEVVPAGAFAAARSQALALPSTSGTWALQGPTNVGGRVLDVVIDPTRNDAIYVATATGGVWHSVDAGKTFTSVWPDDLTQTIGALAIAPDGTLYAGTGEAGPGGGSLTYGGTGVYRSRDGGATWQNVGLESTERIGRVVVDPSDPKRIWVAANGPLYSEGGDRGLYLSTDGGDTWTLTLAGANATTGAVDVALDPDDSQTVFVAMWDRMRKPDSRDYTGGGSALYRSTDGGGSWTNIGTLIRPDNEEVGRMGVAAAPGGIVYVIAATAVGAHGGFYASTDGGDTFVPKSFDEANLTGAYVYGWWFGRIYVDPNDPQHVYTTGVNLSETTDGGATFSAPGGMHSDQHGMAWDPKVEDRIYLGNDGGLYRSDDGGDTWEHGEYMPWNQLFSIDVSQQRTGRIMGGLQDNGGNRSWSGDDQGPDQWNDWTGGDGTEMHINPQDDEIVYGCSQYGACAVSHDGGDSSTAFDNQVIGERKNWLTPIEFDPVNPSTVYTASWAVHRSTDDGANWTVISGDLTDGEQGSTETDPLFRNYDTVSTIATTTADVGFLLVGTDDGHLWYTHDNAANPLTSWTEVNDPDLPKQYVTSTAIDQHNPDVAYVTYSGFRYADDKAHVFKSVDRGVSWDDITGDLPNAPVEKVLVVDNRVFVGTDVGVFVTTDDAHWLRLGGGLPMAPIWDLVYQPKTGLLYAANFGRGAYAIDLASTGEPLVEEPPTTVPPPHVTPPPAKMPATGLPPALPVAAVLGSTAAAVLARRRRLAE
jgi:hypothetical protein